MEKRRTTGSNSLWPRAKEIRQNREEKIKQRVLTIFSSITMKKYFKYILSILLTAFLFGSNYAFASSVQNSQTDGTDKLGLASPPSVFTNTLTPPVDYSAVRLEVQGSNPSGVDLYGHHIYLTLKSGGTTIASCDVSANTLTTDQNNPTWTGCNITPVDLTTTQQYELDLLGYDYWVINASRNMNYKVYGNVAGSGGGGGGGGGSLGTLISLPGSAVADLTGNASQMMTDIWVLLAFLAGVPLGFYLIRKLVLVFQRNR